MVAYGSYLSRKSDVVGTSAIIGGLDTLIALVACMVLFPITFTYGFEPSAGPGLVFQNMPIALMSLPGGSFFATIFFILLFFAALTSAISLLEVAASYFIDEWKWSRLQAALLTGVVITLFGIPSALSNGTAMQGLFNGGVADITGMNWFDSVDWVVSNLLLPFGGMGVALFLTWHVGSKAREAGFKEGSPFQKLYVWWLFLLRWLAPLAVILVFLNAVGVFPEPAPPADEAEASTELQDP
jgi:NSS family neurotransmitter:Na+ symporter